METTPTFSPENPTTKSSLALPIAIVLGFAMIAAAVYYTGNQSSEPKPSPATVEPTAANDAIRPLDETDHIRGNPNAQIMLVEYSDYECPFCKQFHDTLSSIMEEYGTTGQVAWTFRHMPLIQIHPNAVRIAVASECVAELGGNDAFWDFSDLVFEERGLQELTDMSKINTFAASVGVEEQAFVSCLRSDRHLDRVEADLRDALAAGAEGTPHTIILVGDQQAVISGAQPYSTVKQIIETLLAQIDASNS